MADHTLTAHCSMQNYTDETIYNVAVKYSSEGPFGPQETDFPIIEPNQTKGPFYVALSESGGDSWELSWVSDDGKKCWKSGKVACVVTPEDVQSENEIRFIIGATESGEQAAVIVKPQSGSCEIPATLVAC